MIENQKIVIATHALTYGAPHALREYLLTKKVKEVLFISLPFHTQRVFSAEVCTQKRKKIIASLEMKSFGIVDYLIDFLQIIKIVFATRGRHNLFVGVDPLNCLAGIVLKRFGKVEKVIYYSIDFSPIRFRNKILNNLYHAIEKYCVKNADQTWNVSPRIAEGREKFLHIPSTQYLQKVVPIGIWINKKTKKLQAYKRYQAVFVGHLLEKQGIQKVIEAIPQITRVIPDFRFLIIGGGEYEDELKLLVEKYQVQQYVQFLGWIMNKKKVNYLLASSACGVAVYKPEKEKLYNFTYYADPTKLKDYLANGLPIVLTNVSYNTKEIETKQCGIIVDYKTEDIASAFKKLLTNKRNLDKYKINALAYAKGFDWNSIFNRAFSEL